MTRLSPTQLRSENHSWPISSDDGPTAFPSLLYTLSLALGSAQKRTSLWVRQPICWQLLPRFGYFSFFGESYINWIVFIYCTVEASQAVLAVKNPPWSELTRPNAGDLREHRFNPWVRKIPWRRAWQPTPAFLPGESHEHRSLAGYSLQSQTGLNRLSTAQHTTLLPYQILLNKLGKCYSLQSREFENLTANYLVLNLVGINSKLESKIFSFLSYTVRSQNCPYAYDIDSYCFPPHL